MIIFVGQAPGRPKTSEPMIAGTEPPEKAPLSGQAGRRLAAILGIPWERFLLYPRRNLNARFTGKRGKGDAFDVREGKVQADKLRALARSEDTLVLLGVHVARCFGFRWEPFAVKPVGAGRAFLMPHPSGINRFWNQPGNRDDARQLFFCLFNPDVVNPHTI